MQTKYLETSTTSSTSGGVSAADQAFALAAAGRLSVMELFGIAQELAQAGRADAAIDLYRTWLGGPPSPLAYAAQFNLGILLANAGDDAAAEACYRASLEQKPDFIEAYLNLGTLLERGARIEEALATWNAALPHADPANPAQRQLHLQALNNVGRVLENQKRLPEAEAIFTRSLEIEPKQPGVITHWVHIRQKLCHWPVYQPFGGVGMQDLLRHTSALAMLGASPDPAEQLAASQRFIDEKVRAPGAPLAPAEGYRHRRMRIGYLSSDLCSHAVSILTAELYELHDRARVEVFAFSWSREDNSPLRARVVAAMDHYIRIDRMSDEEAAQCIRSHEIDILVDLHGLTLGCRAGILGYRPAPVQLTWLGFPGPTAIPGVDYVVADAFVLPPELEPHFTEKPLRMPHTFQINDRQRAIGPRQSRAANGLPDDKFVFCSFNSNFKITPDVFGAWMRILRRVSDSVLWIVADAPATRTNLIREAEAQGVDGARLLFASRVPPADYLARFQVADLFLDTAPFNAGTTASDALWAGLPVLTWSGRTFCSRMAGSLLHAVGLPELVTHTLEDYEETAVAMATDRARLAALRQRLAEGRDASALFDTPRFVRDFEDLLATVVKRPAGVPVEEAQPVPARAVPVPAPPAPTLQQASMLGLARGGLHSVVEIGGAGLAQAWRAEHPRSRFISVTPRRAEPDWSSDTVLADPEQLSAAQWQQLAAAQCWLFNETLERLRDPAGFLRRLRAEAPRGAEIIACVNNGQHWKLQAQLAGGVPPRAPSQQGTQLFTRTSLAQLLGECGFGIVDMRAVNAEAPAPAVLQALRQLAEAGGADPLLAAQDALPFQYLLRAVAR